MKQVGELRLKYKVLHLREDIYELLREMQVPISIQAGKRVTQNKILQDALLEYKENHNL